MYHIQHKFCNSLSSYHSPYYYLITISISSHLYAGLTGRPVLIRTDNSAQGKISEKKKKIYIYIYINIYIYIYIYIIVAGCGKF